jgi:membrane protease YdiL (CAAX protease family)
MKKSVNLKKSVVMINKKENILFVVCAYAFFWLVLLAGGSVLLLGNEELFNKIVPFVQIIGCWTPTVALLVLFKKLYPNSTVKEFYKNAFKERLNLKILLIYAVLHLLVIVGAASIHTFTKGISFSNLFNLSLQSLLFGFVLALFSGATGEESGWRGYLQPFMEKEYSVITASIIVGIIWAFWHTPTWFVIGLTGMDLIQHILLDILVKISSAVIIGICYNRCRNLIVPVLIHFIDNFFINPIQGTILDFYIWIILLNTVVTIGYIIWHKTSSKKETMIILSK